MRTLRARAGLTRTPWLTLAVVVVTAVPSVLGVLDASVLHALERTPAGLHGQWWRWVTSLVVQDGGAPGTAFNLAFLLALGVVAEQVVGRERWLACYLLTGLAGQVFGHLWQPVGGGNSVAVCGLVGVVVLAALRRADRLPTWAALPVLLWVAALLATPVSTVAGLAVGVLCVRLPSVRWYVGPVLAAAVAGSGVWLVLRQDLHGGALLVGLVIAVVLGRQAGPR